MCKNLKTPAVECLENRNYHVYRKLFRAKISNHVPIGKKILCLINVKHIGSCT